MMMVPREDFEVQNSWKTIATKGTGSHNITLKMYLYQNTEHWIWLAGANRERGQEDG